METSLGELESRALYSLLVYEVFSFPSPCQTLYIHRREAWEHSPQGKESAPLQTHTLDPVFQSCAVIRSESASGSRGYLVNNPTWAL